MTADSWGAHATGLVDRRRECDALDRLIAAIRAGESRALVVRGDPGVGKTALVDHLAGRASGAGLRVARAVGVQSEMELAFAGLHQLCAPMLDRAERLPVPQRDALRTALGVAAGPPPDRFLVGLAVLNLLSEVAGERPLICLVDDEQWLDQASAQALGFAGRRLAADPVGLVVAAREPGAELAGLPELEVGGLEDDDARALLDSALTGPLDAQVRDLIVAETRGNPLALLELPRGLGPAELAGGFGLPGATPLTGRIEDSFTRQLGALPEQSRRLLQLAAADPSGDRALVWRAALCLGIPPQAADPVAEAGLAEFGGRVQFRHPLVRSAAYRSASLSGRRQLHAALQLVRGAGALSKLPLYLSHLGIARLWTGDFTGAASLVAETDSVAAATGTHIAPYTLLRLRALQGREGEAIAAIATAVEKAAADGQGMAAAWAHWAAAVLYNGLARYEEATSAARRALSDAVHPHPYMWALPELVEAAARGGDTELARDALERLAATTRPAGNDVALGIEARCRALLSDGTTADDLYREAIDRLSRTLLRPDRARAHLLYGEWLRRAGRRTDARAQLGTAYEMLDAIGMAAFADRARHELRATGETVRKRTVDTATTLTAQEAHIARLACDGHTNTEIGARLFLSARTVEWHLRKIFTKLGIGSRRELRAALAQVGSNVQSV